MLHGFSWRVSTVFRLCTCISVCALLRNFTTKLWLFRNWIEPRLYYSVGTHLFAASKPTSEIAEIIRIRVNNRRPTKPPLASKTMFHWQWNASVISVNSPSPLCELKIIRDFFAHSDWNFSFAHATPAVFDIDIILRFNFPTRNFILKRGFRANISPS